MNNNTTIDSTEEEAEVQFLKKNFLAALQQVKLGQEGEFDLDTLRTTMCMKYLITRKTQSEYLAMQTLSKELDYYDQQMFKRGILQKIKPEDDKRRGSQTNTILDYQSGLTKIEDIASYIKPLPCQTDPAANCKKTVPEDSDIEAIVKIWSETENSLEGYPGPRVAETAVDEAEEIRLRKQEKRDLFLGLYQKYSNKSPTSHIEPKSIASSSSMNKENVEESRKAIQPFKTGRALEIEEKNAKKTKKTLGGKSSIYAPFVSPMRRKEESDQKPESQNEPMELEDECLKNIDPKMVEMITNEIMIAHSRVSWSDIAGLEHTKNIICEAIVYPILRPDIFQGLRKPPKGILFFGPPGTGKTLIGKCIASQSESTFFSISASSLTSKYVGEGEKMVRALFAVARLKQPSVIFIDEVDSLLTQRSDTEHESSRRLKTEFLVQLDGAATNSDDKILVIGATNRPQELDEAARRRFVKRLYIPLPDHAARKQIVMNLIASERHNLTDDDINKIAEMAENYSGSDMTNLCKEASMGPIRSIPMGQLEKIRPEDVRGLTAVDFHKAFSQVRPSVSLADLGQYVQWNDTYGTRIDESAV